MSETWKDWEESFDLSSKIMPCIHRTPELKEIDRHDILMIQDVKEFIRRLKDEFCDEDEEYSCYDIRERIDKLAGEKLI